MKTLCTCLTVSVAITAYSATISDRIAPNAIRATLMSVADWQLANPATHPATDWTQAALYTGMMALDGISPDPRYRDAMRAMGESNAWAPGGRVYHADDHCVGQTYLDLYDHDQQIRMIEPIRARFDEILASPATNSLRFEGPHAQVTRRWSWCDALFMAPPAWLKMYRITGDARYRTFAISNWWATSDLLYDRQAHLFFRDSRYLTQREANGRKIFWSRGNGWVLAGLARVLQVLPSDDPDRARFEQQFSEMAAAVRACQQEDGLWRSSLLDPEHYPRREASGTGFFVYGLTWGVNQGLLDRATYEPAIRKGWQGLVACVETNGRLAHVQPIGADPKVFDEQHTDVYGVGAFLLAGSELHRLALTDAVKGAPLEVRNPAGVVRKPETVEVPWSAILERLPDANGDTVAVLDTAQSRLLPVQVIDLDGDHAPDQLLFQASFLPGETCRYRILSGLSAEDQPPSARRTFARFVPERKDDFAWENDRIAFRVYGPALAATSGEVCGSGIDVWLKSTRQPVIDGWYAKGDYHTDHGEGLDAYKVGTMRGCGGLAIKTGPDFAASGVFTQWVLRAAGPIRAVFELDYGPWKAGDITVHERRRISLDLGSNWSRMESTLVCDPAVPVEVAVGLARRAGEGSMQGVEQEGWLAYTEPDTAPNGRTHVAVVLPTMMIRSMDDAHWWARRMLKAGEPFLYWAGAGWSKADHATPEDWQRDVQRFAWLQRHPLDMVWPR